MLVGTSTPDELGLQVMSVLRRLRPSDLDTLLAVQREGAIAGLGHIFPQEEHPFPTAEVRARWERELADESVDAFAIVLAGELAGFAATRANEFLHFGTAVNTWGSGLAGIAHDEVIEHFRHRGHPTAFLWVFEDNHRAVRFYTARNWRATNERMRTTFAPHPVLRRYEIDLSSAPANAEGHRSRPGPASGQGPST